jgi:hypothetical protein
LRARLVRGACLWYVEGEGRSAWITMSPFTVPSAVEIHASRSFARTLRTRKARFWRSTSFRLGTPCRARGFGLERWWRWEELNLRHGAYETPALPLSYTAVRSKIRNLAKGFYRTGSDCTRDCAQGSHRGFGPSLARPASVPAGRRCGTHPASKSRPTATPKRSPRPKPRTKARRVTGLRVAQLLRRRRGAGCERRAPVQLLVDVAAPDVDLPRLE